MEITYQSPSSKERAIEQNSICKNCRSNQIPSKLSYEQEQILNGLMLGDGCIVYPRKYGSNYPRLTITRQLEDKEYLFWQYNVFKEFYGTEPKYFKSYHNKAEKFYEGYSSRTKSGEIFKLIRQAWYDNNGKKIIPKNLKITPLVLLIWFLDDGCIITKSENNLIIKFATDGFSYDDVYFLKTHLNDSYQINLNIYKNGNGFILKGSTIAAKMIISIIDPIFILCMNRKRTWT
jgi:hypothetical protein